MLRAWTTTRAAPCAACFAASWLFLALAPAWGEEIPAKVKAMAKEYLSVCEAAQTLAGKLDQSGCDPIRVVRALRPKPEPDVKPGYYDAEHFRSPELRKKHPDDLLFYVVPESYRPD